MHGRNTGASGATAPSTFSCVIDARLETSMASGRALLDLLAAGGADFLLTSLDGSIRTRVRLSIEGVQPAAWAGQRGSVKVDWSRSTIANGTSRVALSNTELRLLAALLEGNERPVSRSTLIRRVWPGDALPIQDRENALTVYVCALRKRLASIGLGSALQTVRRTGYRVAF